MNMWLPMKNAMLPFAPFSRGQLQLLLAAQVAVGLGFWFGAAPGVLPSPRELCQAWLSLVLHQGLLLELWVSVKVLLLALLISSAAALAIATAATAPMFDALARFASSLRFLGFAGLSYVFMLMAGDAGQLKLALLVFGITVMMVTAMLAEVRAIPASAIEHCKTLGMRHWRISYELVVLGKADVFLDLVRQNAAVGWTLLAMVEGLTRSQGGIGALLLNQNRYFQLSGVFAIQLTILCYGLGQDYLLGQLRKTLCPYAHQPRRSAP
jgi:ABC-type nitrate/sulfonate/bicarbonate transport system permease component